MTPRIFFLAALLLAAAAAPGRAEEVRLTLEECLQRAIANALPIAEAVHDPRIARTFVDEAESEFDHLLSFAVQGGYTRRPSTSFFTGPGSTLKEQTFSGSIALSQRTRYGGHYRLGFFSDDLQTNSGFYNYRPLWTNRLAFELNQPLLRGAGREVTESGIRIAELDLGAAQADLRFAVQETLAATERAYWRLVFLLGDADHRRQSLTTAEELHRVAGRRLEAGAGTRIELVQAEAGVAQRTQDLIVAEAAVKVAEDLLRSFVFPFSDAPAAEIRIVPVESPGEPSANPPPVDHDSALAIAFAERPDVAAYRERIEATGIRVITAENDLLPRLDAFGLVDFAGADDGFTEAMPESRYPGFLVGLTLEVPLGNRGAEARRRRAVLLRSRAIAEFETLKNQVILEVRAAERAIDTSRRRVAAARAAVAAAEAQFEAEQDRVAAERSTNYQLLQVEEDLAVARIEELAALVSYRNAIVDLLVATGRFLSERGIAPPAEGDYAAAPEGSPAGEGSSTSPR